MGNGPEDVPIGGDTDAQLWTRFVLDTMHPQVQRDLSDCHTFHQRIMQAFPTASSDSPRAEFGLLYRIELSSGRRPEAIRLLQSGATRRLGEFAARLPGPDDLSNINPAVKEVGQMYDRISPGSRFRFRLRANPTRRVLKPRKSDHDNMIGKRVQLFTDEERTIWMERKGTQGGFEVEPDSLAIQHGDTFGPRQYGARGNGSNRSPLTFEATVFEGVLTVTDAAAFQTTLRSGIGSGKAYGFGLLSIAPPGPRP